MKDKLLYIHHSAFLLHHFFFILSILSILFLFRRAFIAGLGLVADSEFYFSPLHLTLLSGRIIFACVYSASPKFFRRSRIL
jgi:hypothetical protein